MAISVCQVQVDHSYVVLKFTLQKYMGEVRLALPCLE